MQPIKIIIEKHLDGYVADPIGIKGIIVGEGDTYEEAIADVKSAIQFHIDSFGREVLETNEISETFLQKWSYDEVPQGRTEAKGDIGPGGSGI